MMAFSSFSSNGLAFLLLLAVALVDSARGCVFYAGGKDGWVLNPLESYGHWAERNQFQVNDSIVFKYKKGEDSVLVVAEQDFDSCDVSNPFRKLDGGDSRFVFERSGPFFLRQRSAGEVRARAEAGSGGDGRATTTLAARLGPAGPASDPCFFATSMGTSVSASASSVGDFAA
ncbi:hypothetical protein ZIOFF_018722 [Zingiber officinale]|uniref:Phytocyanin domain-containing protein n=1 Tax=Zingiber officinale TaxID=94328 RepID=A0A8J5HQP3_ZINOF|nr:hypothetical protein ZIOFF_018722 [Zingiber officinale]